MDVMPAILDPELGCVGFTVERKTYTRGRTGVNTRTATSSASGCIHPGTAEMIQLLPEEEKSNEFIAIYTGFALSTGTPENTNTVSFVGADVVQWDGRSWRVVKVRDWKNFGYYQALAVLVQ